MKELALRCRAITIYGNFIKSSQFQGKHEKGLKDFIRTQ